MVVPRLQKALGLKPSNFGEEFWAVKNISFEIRKGEIVGIIGKNGSGKSTLLQLVCGTLNPTHGTITTHGKVAALLELGSGFNPEFTGRENIYLNASVFGLDAEAVNQKLEDIIAFAEIGQFIDQPIKTYSTGMVVRLAFAVIAHVDADILVIDEALSVGDAFFVQKCMRFLHKFIQRGTLLFCSHDMGAVRSLCTKVALMDKGSLVTFSDPKSVSELYLEKLHDDNLGAQKRQNVDAVGEGHGSDRDAVETLDVSRNSQKTLEEMHQRGIAVFEFNPQSASFGVGGVTITNVALKDADQKIINWTNGVQSVTLEIDILAAENIYSPIVGFFVRDKNGQNLFGDNTFLSCVDRPLALEKQTSFTAIFKFMMPRLANGDYFISVAVASGTQNNHLQHCWMHDALHIKSSGNAGVTGIIGLPMDDIKLEKVYD
jgi:lipopolysaccharide transport system ATP-binding protein